MTDVPEPTQEKPATRSRRRRLLLLLAPLLLAVAGGLLWFTGVLPFSSGHAAQAGTQSPGEIAPLPHAPPAFVDVPEIIANLNGSGRRNIFVKLHAKIEVARADDQAAVLAVLPRLQDLFQTYLRDLHPDELRGSAGTWRLREELVARANIAAAPAHVTSVLFTDLLVQ